MFVNLFENAFTADYKRIQVKENSSLLEIAKDNNLDLKNCLCFVNGSEKNSDYILKEKDICTIRQFPSAVSGTVVGAVVVGLIGAYILEESIRQTINDFGGNAGKTVFDNFYGTFSSSLKVANSETSRALPSISGSSNTSALGRAIPFIMGKTLFAPYIINQSYTTISDGDNENDKFGGVQTFHCLYLIGYNDLKIENVSLGNHLICSNSESKENGILVNDGNYFSDEIYSPKIEIQQGAKEVSLISQKVVQKDYNVELLNYKNIDTEFSAYGFSAKYPQKIEIELQLPNGLYGYNSDGNQIEKTVSFCLQMSIDGGENWIACPFSFSHCTRSYSETYNASQYRISEKYFYTMRLVGSLILSDNQVQEFNNLYKKYKNTSSAHLFEAFANYTKAYNFAESIEDHVIQFKLFKVTEDDASSNDVDQIIFSAIRTWCYDNKLSNSTDGLVAQVPMIEKYRNRTCRLGFEIKADDLTKGTLDQLTVIATSKASIWNGNAWTSETQATNNPAALALLALTKNVRGDYAYEIDNSGTYLTSDKIDLESFGKTYEICDKNISWTDSKGKTYNAKTFECNGAVVNQTKTIDLVNNILKCARSFLVLRGKKYGIFTDVAQENSVLVLNNQNLLSRKNSKEFNDIPDGFSINFVNALEDYQEDSIVVVPSGVDETDSNLKLEQLEYPYLTNAYHVKKEGLYQLRCRNLRPEIWEAQIGIDGYLVEVGDKVELQDDTILVGIGDGAEVKTVLLNDDNTAIIGIKTDNKFHITDLSQTYAIKYTKIVQRNNNSVPRVFVQKLKFNEPSNDEYYDEFYFENEISLDDESLIEVDNIIALGIYGNETTQAICFGKKDNGDSTFDLTLIPYDENIYNDSLTIFDYDSKITKPIPEGSVIDLTTEKLNEKLEKSNSVFTDKLSKLSDAISNITVDADTTPPTVPELQSCVSDSLGDISITFLQSTDEESGVDHYIVYTKQDSGVLEQVLVVQYDSTVSNYVVKHSPSIKNKDYVYYVSAVDKLGNESSLSSGITVKSLVSEKPYIPTTLTATAYENYIKLNWDFEQSTNSVYKPNTFKLEVKRSSTSSWEEISDCSINEFSYYFDRTKDGYPEKETLAEYQFRVKSISVYDVESDYCSLTNLNTDNYLGWQIGTIDLSSYAVEGLLYIKINYTNSSYGEKYFTVNYGDNVIAENVSAGRLFTFKLSGYQEVSDITSKDIVVSCKSVANSSSVTLKGSNIDTSLYKTYKITKPTVSAYADKIGVHITWTDNTVDYYLIPTYTLQINSEDVLSAKNVLSYDSLFDNNTYPTKDDIAKISIKLKVLTDADSVEVSNITIDVSNFLGWIPEVPDLKTSVSGRTIPLSWNIQTDVYDFLGCEIQVAKAYKLVNDNYTVITDETELEWYAPALGLNPYESLDNYKKGDKNGYLSVKCSSVAFSVPLYGQDNDGAVSTMYAYRARAYTKGGKSSWTDTYFVEVKPVSAYDVVKAWDLNDSGEKVKLDGALGANQIFVNELSAICANLGYITDGALQTDSYNYWAVNDTPLEDGTTLAKGSFRVGGSDEYIEVSPILDSNGLATGNYTMNIVAKTFTTKTSVSILSNKLFLVRDTDGNILFKAGVYEKSDTAEDYGLEDGDDKNYIRVNEGYFYAKKLRTLNSSQLLPSHYTEANYMFFHTFHIEIVQPLFWNNKIYYLTYNQKYLDWAISLTSEAYFIPSMPIIDVYSVDSNGNNVKEFSVENMFPQSTDTTMIAFGVSCSLYNGYLYGLGTSFSGEESEDTEKSVIYKINLETQEKEVFDYQEISDTIESLIKTKNTNFIEYKEVNFLCFMDNNLLGEVTRYAYDYSLESSSSTYNSNTTYYDKNGNVQTVTKDTYTSGTYYTRTSTNKKVFCIQNIEDSTKFIILDDVLSEFGSNEICSYQGWAADDDYLYLTIKVLYGSAVLKIPRDLSTIYWAATRLSLEIGADDTTNDLLKFGTNYYVKNRNIKVMNDTISFVGTYNCFKITESGSAERQIYNGIFEIKNPLWVEGKSIDDVSSSLQLSTVSVYANFLGNSPLSYFQSEIIDDSTSFQDIYILNNFYSPLQTTSQDRFFVSRVYKENNILDGFSRNIFELTKVESEETQEYDGFEILGTVAEAEISSNIPKNVFRGSTVLCITPISSTTYFVLYMTDSLYSQYFLPYFKHSETLAGNEFQHLLVAAMFDTKEEFVVTQKNTYETGIGFTGFYKDRISKNYRYLLASGAYLEFDKNGKLVVDAKGSKGDKGETGATGNGIASVAYYYATSTTQTQPSTVTSTSIPTLSSTNKYLWQKEVITYTDGTNKTTIALIGVYGDKGNTGEKGTSITKVEQTQTSSSPSGKNKLTITLSNGTQSEFVVTNGAVGDEDLILTDDDFAEIIS